ncbi:phosphatase PAP2-related protein [Anaeromyxobacter terrae]|uniref:phosphatase PAP2-related protein n=1 Tax=Anaeromyxobacter terrae TaxID=2925406 RepID=UPI001F560056|nr:phosphatase PAP2-related protein [Anaeromyxobacter sp. SG22]
MDLRRAEAERGELRAPAPEPDARARGLAGLRALWPVVLGALAFRAACYAVMTAAAVWNERRPAPPLPDLVLSAVPYVDWVARTNYVLWLVAYVPLALVLLWRAPRRFARYTVTGGLVSLARGATLVLTGLGAPPPQVGGVGIAGHASGEVFRSLMSPWQVFADGSMRAYLTQDLFFSGHTATTLLLLLYVWRSPPLRAAALVAHVLVVASVFLSHLHYGIDVVGAYAVTFAIFALREGWPARAGDGA